MQDDREGTCRSCGKPIIWREHVSTGKSMPLEVAPDGETSGFVLFGSDWYTPAYRGDAGQRYVSHFATCPQADQWRAGSRPAAALEPKTRAGDPDTSHEAAASVSTATVHGTRARILQVLHAARGPLTDEDIAARIAARWPTEPVTPSGARTRRSELEARKLVAVTDRDGRTSAGRACRRYGLTAAGVVEAEGLTR